MPSEASTTSSTPKVIEDSTEDEQANDRISRPSPLKFVFIVFALLVVPLGIGMYCGGLAWCRRVLRGNKPKGKYTRVSGKDLEK